MTKITVVWCKWHWWIRDFRLHYRTFRNVEKARKYKPKKGFIWSYVIDNKEVEKL